jgi:hypothetical protein
MISLPISRGPSATLTLTFSKHISVSPVSIFCLILICCDSKGSESESGMAMLANDRTILQKHRGVSLRIQGVILNFMKRPVFKNEKHRR